MTILNLFPGPPTSRPRLGRPRPPLLRARPVARVLPTTPVLPLSRSPHLAALSAGPRLSRLQSPRPKMPEKPSFSEDQVAEFQDAFLLFDTRGDNMIQVGCSATGSVKGICWNHLHR